ncbi:XRE family transcriptional regulator [Herbiconiux moechotypicola]|uniref:Cupin domain-containing protein n=1 Tax=Herbiconiux moechotypicola TaxID=637393 RepID=A0ABP5R5A3_9MICO|nr:XRE family transcriptional regulator [Herbiconiux moechotypicola]MCS5731789.1 XRE family transcriptional regulator [Herbiconiux moechotypicola]
MSATTIGELVREARSRAGLSMRALAALVEVSQPFLSQVENGRANPSLATLYRLADALGVPASALLPEAVSAGDVLQVGADGGRMIPVSAEPGSASGRMLTIGAGHPLEVVEYRVAPGESLGGWFSGPGEQTLFVIEGSVTVELDDGRSFSLKPGGAVTHPSSVPHRWVPGPLGCRLLLSVAHGQTAAHGSPQSSRDQP